MGFPTSVNSQITDAVTQAHMAGGDEVLSVISVLMSEIAESLDGAKQGEATMEKISVAFENAEGLLHEIVARLANANK